MFEYAWLIVVLPLVGFLICLLAGRYLPEGGAHVVVGALLGSTAISLWLFVEVLQLGAVGGEVSQIVPGFTWMPGVEFGLLIDNLSALMLLLVSFLSLLIAIYSIGYMHDEEGKPRYYAEISLFVAGMLGTVSADNFLQLLIFWEVMGLCSYLLIGFWYRKPEAARAAKKAFLVTRIGDVLFLIGVLVIWNTFGTFSFAGIQAGIEGQFYAGVLDTRLLTVIPLLLFGGAIGKSAQFPLHVWLPDAMEGPTTVSALIHAATMVKAGVYLTARSFLFLIPILPTAGIVLVNAVPWTAILVIAAIGGFSALFAATMAVVNFDIKRVLAFSTISQLGYMFLALGAGAYLIAHEAESNPSEIATTGYSAALFHLMNHAFFKALLFLAAGSVIHAVHTNDMRQMGGLGKHMKWTSLTMLVGSLALAGIPPFSGFWSKDEILAVTFENGAANSVFYLLWIGGVVTAFLTGFYAFRMWFMTFHGEYRGSGHPHESPPVMTGPLVALALFAVISGVLVFFTGGFTNLVFYGEPLEALPLLDAGPVELVLAVLSVVVAGAGVFLAWYVYAARRYPAENFTRTPIGAAVHRTVSNRYYIDAAYDAFGGTVVYGTARASDYVDRHWIDGAVNAVGRWTLAASHLQDWFDRKVIDGAVNALSLQTVRRSLSFRTRQTGRVGDYAWVIAMGILVVIVTILVMRAIGGR